MDLRDAIGVLKTKGNEGYKIGIAKENITSFANTILSGTVVLFREVPGSDTLIVGIPMNQDEILKQKAKGSVLVTKSAIVCVPKYKIEEVIIE